MTEPTTALVVRSTYLAPPSKDEFESMISMANSLAKAQGFLPAHFFGQPYKILAAILYGRDLGISATNALQHIIVIEGKATADAQLIGMLVRRAGHQMVDETTDTASTVTITRSDGTVHEATFSIQDAQRAGLVRPGGAWTKYPAAMLYARALTACARKGAQDALMGTVYTPEEMGVEVDGEGTVIMPPSAPTGEIPAAMALPESREALSMAEEIPPSPTKFPEPPQASAVAPAALPAVAPQNGKRRGRPLGSKNAVKAEAVSSVAAVAAPAFGDEPVPEDALSALRTQIHDLASRLRKYQYLEKGAALPNSELWEKEIFRTLGIFIERKFGTDVALEDVEEAGLQEAISDLKGFLTKYETPYQEGVAVNAVPAAVGEREQPPPPDTTVVQLHKPIVRNAVTAPRRGAEMTQIDPQAALERIRQHTQANPDRDVLYGDLVNRQIGLLAIREGLHQLTGKDEARLRSAATAQIDNQVRSGFNKNVAELSTTELSEMIEVVKRLTPKS